MDNKPHGIFAIRSPKRPAAIGLSTVQVIKVKENKLWFHGADMLDDTPLLDIKPLFIQTDNRPQAISGWLDEKEETLAQTTRSDRKFAQNETNNKRDSLIQEKRFIASSMQQIRNKL